MKDIIQKITQKLTKYGIIIISFIIGLIGILSIFITAYFSNDFSTINENTFYKFTPGIFEILITLISLIILAILARKILKKVPDKYILIPVFLALLLVSIYWINVIKLCPEADQKSVHEAACALINAENPGAFFELGDRYMYIFPYQLGIAYIFSIIYRIFGQNWLYVQYINAILSIINFALLLYISKLLFNESKIQKILIVLLSFFGIYWIFFNPHVYGNIIGLTFALLSLIFTIRYLKNNKLIEVLFAGIFVSISILAKSNYNIFLCAIVVVLILKIVENWKLKSFVPILLLIISSILINTPYEAILKHKYNMTTEGGMPMISYIYMGMDEPRDKAPGWYTGIILEIYGGTFYNEDLTIDLMKEKINDRISYFINNPSAFFGFYAQKIASTWLNPTFQTVYYSMPFYRLNFYQEYANYFSVQKTAQNILSGNLYKFEEFSFDIYQIVIFIFASIGIFLSKKEREIAIVLIPITVFGGFLFHIIWETKAIYVIQYYFILLPYAAFGLNYIFDKTEIFINKVLNKNKQV